jgi:hypothetical protein
MNTVNYKNTILYVRKTLVILAVFGLTQYVFAVDGILSSGKKSKSSSTFSSIQKDMKLSLKSGFNFNSNKSFGISKSGKKGTILNTVVSYQKGNVTYYLPYRTKPILQKFKTPSAPVIR